MSNLDWDACKKLMVACFEDAKEAAIKGNWEDRYWLVTEGVQWTIIITERDVPRLRESIVACAQPKLGRGWTVQDALAWIEKREQQRLEQRRQASYARWRRELNQTIRTAERRKERKQTAATVQPPLFLQGQDD